MSFSPSVRYTTLTYDISSWVKGHTLDVAFLLKLSNS